MRNPSQAWRLAPHRHAAVSGGDLVLLDTAAGSYACIPGGGVLVQPTSEHFALQIEDPALAKALAESGWVIPGFALTRRPPVRRPVRALPIAAGPATGPQIWRMGWALCEMGRHFHGRSFDHLIAVARRRPSAARRDEPGLTAEVAAFRALLPWAPFQGVCLYRSFLLLQMLRHSGRDATWMFGVRTWPFEAHCWLQVDDLVLDDHLDHVAGYVPILAV